MSKNTPKTLPPTVVIYDGDTLRGTPFKGMWIAVPVKDWERATASYGRLKRIEKLVGELARWEQDYHERRNGPGCQCQGCALSRELLTEIDEESR